MRTTIEPAEGTPLACQCALPLSRRTLTFVAGLLRARLKRIGSRWRKLPPGRIALIVLATLRRDHQAGRGGSAAGRHPDPHPPPFRHREPEELQRQAQETRAAVPRPHRPGREPDLDLLRPPRRRQRDPCRPPRPPRRPAPRRGLGALADLGFTGLDPDPGDPVIITGYKSTRASKTTPAQRQANQALSAARAPVEHGFCDLKNWRSLTRLRTHPGKATALLRALLVLTRQHTTR